jgi:hypothetical protein
MLPAELIALAAAHGANLEQAFQLASAEKAKSQEITVRAFNPEVTGRSRYYRVLRPRSSTEANGKATRSYARKPMWTIAELGQASQGLAPILFDAACYHFACDLTPRARLYANLVMRARQLRSQRQWPQRIQDKHGISIGYIRHLALMVLDEDQCQPLFKLCDGVLYSIYMNCHEKTWEARLSGPYEDLRLVWLGWLQSARSHIAPRIRNQERV